MQYASSLFMVSEYKWTVMRRNGQYHNCMSFGLGRTYILFWSKLSLSSVIFCYEFYERFSFAFTHINTTTTTTNR